MKSCQPYTRSVHGVKILTAVARCYNLGLDSMLVPQKLGLGGSGILFGLRYQSEAAGFFL